MCWVRVFVEGDPTDSPASRKYLGRWGDLVDIGLSLPCGAEV